MNSALKNAKPTDWAQAFFPNLNAEQAEYLKSTVESGLSSLQSAITNATDIVIEDYNRRIEAQKEVVAADDDAISKLEQQLDKEMGLKNKGRANNVIGIQKELAAKNAQRTQDLAKQKEYQREMAKVQKAQLIAQTALEASNLILSSTSIYEKATAVGGPLAIPIAIAAITAMFGSFIAAKAKAFQATSDASSFGKGGIIDGKPHSEGGQKYVSVDGSGNVVELEGGEHVINKKSTNKYLPILKAINEDSLHGMSDTALAAMLEGMGIHFESDVEQSEAIQAHRQHVDNTINGLNINHEYPGEFKNMEKYLKEMAEDVRGKITTYEEGDYVVTRKGNKIIKTRKN